MLILDIFILFCVGVYLLVWAESMLLSYSADDVTASSIIKLRQEHPEASELQQVAALDTLLHEESASGK